MCLASWRSQLEEHPSVTPRIVVRAMTEKSEELGGAQRRPLAWPGVQGRLTGEGMSEMRSESWPEVGLIRREEKGCGVSRRGKTTG